MGLGEARRKVVVVGAGFSGLMTAYYLQEAGYDVEIYERGERVGGLIRTFTTTFGLVETAANGFINSVELERLCKLVGIPMVRTGRKARARYIFRERPRRFPIQGAREIFTVCKFVLKFLLARDLLRPLAKETIRKWGARVLSPMVSFFTVETALQGIYAGDPSRMSASLILKRLFDHGSRGKPKIRGSVAPEKGMSEFAERLAGFLEKNGAKIHFKSNYELPAQLDCPHVIATPAPVAAKLVHKHAPAMSEALLKVEYVPLITATVFWDQQDHEVRGFGCLFPPSQNPERKSYALGMLMNNYIFPGRSKDSLSETWLLGGARALGSNEFFDFDDENILDRIRRRRLKMFGKEGRLLHHKVTRWAEALPHYTVEHEETVKLLGPSAQIYLMGNYLGQIGLAQILERAGLTVAQIKESGRWK